jgi:4'-phosphopantetheinyl transferase
MTGRAAGSILGADAEVWTLDLTRDVDESVLEPDELERGDRFVFARDRVRFRRRRAQLRHLLAGYAGVAPADLRFRRNEYGKPTLDGTDLHFSSSSSGDVAMFAVGAVELGVDVEVIRPDLADEQVALRMFAPEEAAAVAAGTPADFFRCWTRKEAYVKAVGQGLSFPLQSFAIEVADVPCPRLTRSDLRPGDLAFSTIADLSSVAYELTAALVVRAPSAGVMMHSASTHWGTTT